MESMKTWGEWLGRVRARGVSKGPFVAYEGWTPATQPAGWPAPNACARCSTRPGGRPRRCSGVLTRQSADNRGGMAAIDGAIAGFRLFGDTLSRRQELEGQAVP